MSGLIEQRGVILNIKPLHFTDKSTGELVRGLKVILGRPASEDRHEYDGFGYVPFDLRDISPAGLTRASSLIEQVKDCWLQEVVVDCEVDLSNSRFPRFKPISIRPLL